MKQLKKIGKFYKDNILLIWLTILYAIGIAFLFVILVFFRRYLGEFKGSFLQMSGTLAAGFIVVLGWVFNKYDNYQKLQQEHIKKQISEFYTPIYGLILKYKTVEDFIRKSNRFYKKMERYFPDRIHSMKNNIDKSQPDKSGKAVDYVLEKYTFEIFDDITDIIYTKSYLIDEEECGVPEYVKDFLDHATMTNILTKYWIKEHEETDFIRFYEFPDEFEICIKKKLDELQKTVKIN